MITFSGHIQYVPVIEMGSLSVLGALMQHCRRGREGLKPDFRTLGHG